MPSSLSCVRETLTTRSRRLTDAESTVDASLLTVKRAAPQRGGFQDVWAVVREAKLAVLTLTTS